MTAEATPLALVSLATALGVACQLAINGIRRMDK